MNCTSCGSELKPGARVCDACGAPIEEPSAQQTASPYDAFLAGSPAGSEEPEKPVSQAEEESVSSFQLPPAQPEPTYEASSQSERPAVNAALPGARVYGVSTSEEKILGMPASQMGNIALGLGGAGCLFSLTVCGGLLFGILGAIAGFLSLRTSGRRNGTIGLILGILGVIVALSLSCGVLLWVINGPSTSYGY